MAGQHGYANPNQFSMLNLTQDDDSSTTSGTHHTIAAATVPTMDSTLGRTTVNTMSPEVSAAFAQMAANQNSLMMQMQALSVIPPPPPPIHHINIPTQQLPAPQE